MSNTTRQPKLLEKSTVSHLFYSGDCGGYTV